ncbi:MAG: hypothetical protein HIU84_13770 [Acidobacteria bacterium]|nr:hypothetical protein [Acidobacteriota bacterium]
MILGTAGGTGLSLLNVNPIRLLVLIAIIDGVLAAPLLVVVMIVSRSRSLMCEYVNGKVANFLGWLTVALMAGASIAMLMVGGLFT